MGARVTVSESSSSNSLLPDNERESSSGDSDEEQTTHTSTSFVETVARLFRPLFGSARTTKALPPPQLTKEQRTAAEATIGRHVAMLHGLAAAAKTKRKTYLRLAQASHAQKQLRVAEGYMRIAVTVGNMEEKMVENIHDFEQMLVLLQQAEITRLTATTFFNVNKTLQQNVIAMLRRDGKSLENFGDEFRETMDEMREITAKLEELQISVTDAHAGMPMSDAELEEQIHALPDDDDNGRAMSPSPSSPSPSPSSSSVAPLPTKSGKSTRTISKKKILLGDDVQ